MQEQIEVFFGYAVIASEPTFGLVPEVFDAVDMVSPPRDELAGMIDSPVGNRK